MICFALRKALNKMDKKRILSDKNMIAKKKRLVITSQQKCDVTERHECSHSNSKIGQDVRMLNLQYGML
jgi:hypothetical protein